MWNCGSSIANALELLRPGTEPSISWLQNYRSQCIASLGFLKIHGCWWPGNPDWHFGDLTQTHTHTKKKKNNKMEKSAPQNKSIKCAAWSESENNHGLLTMFRTTLPPCISIYDIIIAKEFWWPCAVSSSHGCLPLHIAKDLHTIIRLCLICK